MIICENLAKIKELFNLGALTIADVDFYAKQGYGIICCSGRVDEIIPPVMDLAQENNDILMAL